MSKKKYTNYNFLNTEATESVEALDQNDQVESVEFEADANLEPTEVIAEDEKIVEADPSYDVKVSINALNIRTGPGKNYDKTGKYTGVGIFTIVETRDGEGSETGWGRLKSDAGWICLDFTERV